MVEMFRNNSLEGLYTALQATFLRGTCPRKGVSEGRTF